MSTPLPRNGVSAPASSLRPPSGARARRDLWLAVTIAAVAVLIRLPYLGWGLPDLEEEAFPLKKAFQMWGWDEGGVQLDPRTAGWPSLSFYVHLLLQHLLYLVGRLSGAFANRYDFWLLQDDMTPLVLAARAVGVLAASGAVWVTTRLGARLSGTVGGLLAGSALAVSPLLVEQSLLITPDILLTLCAALAVARIVDIHERGTMRDHVWAGIWIGLGISVKYSPILLAPALYLTHLRRRRAENRSEAGPTRTSNRWLGLGDRRLLAAALACILAFVLTSPFLLLDLAVFKKDFTSQVAHMSQGHFGHEARGAGSLYYVRDVLAPAFGWPGLAFALAGLAWAVWRRRGAWLVPAVCAACLYAGLALLRTQFDRYMLPLLLPIALGLGAAWMWLAALVATRAGSARRRGGALRAAALALLALVVLGPPAWSSARLLRQHARPSTLQLAMRYIVETLGNRDLAYLMEAYTPHLPQDRRVELGQHPAFVRLSPAQQQRLLAGPVYHVVTIPMYSGTAERSSFYYDLRHCLPIDIIVTSSSVRGRYERNPQQYGQQVRFYRDLDAYAERLRTFAPDAATRGPEIRLYRLNNDDRARLLRERGRPEPGFHRAFETNLHAPHFHAFLEGVANAAYAKQMYGVAELYLQTLDETTDPTSPRPWLPALAAAKLETGQPAAARELCVELLRRDPRDHQAEAMLGFALEALGDTAGAIPHYERCVALCSEKGGDAEGFAAWARERSDELKREPSRPSAPHRPRS